jgi:preprotein translocase subunit SecD
VAPPAGTIRPGRYLAIFLLIVVGLYSLVFFTGDGKPVPKLGIDLQGGTSVVLTARTPDGSEPSRDSLNTARSIINQRVDGLGVSGAEVVLDGNNIVITVPGSDNSEQAKTLSQTAKLGFREVIAGPFDPAQLAAADDEGQGDSGDEDSGDKKDEESKGDKPKASSGGEGNNGSGGGSAPASAADRAPAQQPENDDNLDEETKKQIAAARKVRQSKDLASQDQNKQSAAIEAAVKALEGCGPKFDDPLRGNDRPDLPLVACHQKQENSDAGPQAYVLGPVVLDGTMVSNSTSSVNPDGAGYQVNIDFTSEGNEKWSELTAQLAQKSKMQPTPALVAFVLDTEVVSAPQVTQQISGNTRITGDFSEQEARDLAEILKYGSLPLSFETQDAQSVSPTLGLSSLRAGLIAGAIGLALVALYCLFYYRLLGVLLFASLVLTAGVVYPVIILLGRSVGYTLDLAGVAGLIISVGVTADSFIIYFERIKDEIRDGRSVRSAVPRAWVRARRTILSADAVVLLAAVVLYILAIGQVKGFAFTVGLSTALDLLVVFLVTHPLMVVAGNWKILNNRALSGLGLVQDAGREVAARRKARTATAKGV